MVRVYLPVELTSTLSDPVSQDIFGVNTLFQADSLEVGADFTEIVSEIQTSGIRYPGGTVSEEYFDISNPNATEQENVIDVINGVDQVRSVNVTPLSDFLDFCSENSISPILVLPTYRFFDQDTRSLAPDAEETIRAFLLDLLSGIYGPVDNLTIEIGNEWYQDRFNWTTEEFGAFQAQVASIIDSVAHELGLRDGVSILAQAAQDTTNNEILASHFSGEAAETIDGVATHLYGTNSTGDVFGIGGGIGRRLESITSIWSSALGADFELAVTEWNVGESGPETTLINGLERSLPLLRIFIEMLMNGVDVATVWSTQTPGPAGLSPREGRGDDLTPTGYLFSMLSNALTGAALAETSNGFTVYDEAGTRVGNTYTFVSGSDTLTYVVSGTGDSIDLALNLAGYYSPDAYVYAVVLGPAPGFTGTEYSAEASISYLTNLSPQVSNSGEAVFNVELGAYEVIEIHVVYGHGIELHGDRHNAVSDEFFGGAYNDSLFGNLGDDQIHGFEGEDLLDGGSGNDTLDGGQDHDTMNGGEGDDILMGGHGRDFLDGGDGNDNLAGGNWHDTLIGGIGDDLVAGDSGNDVIYYTSGSDTIDGGEGVDTISFENSTSPVSVWADEGVVETEDELVVLSGCEVVIGSNSDDRITGPISTAGENNILEYYGLGGDDFISVQSGNDIYVDCGVGDDLVYFVNATGTVLGGLGNDNFFSYGGSGWFDGGPGNDVININNSSQDTFYFDSESDHDVINGFQLGVDEIEIHGFTAGQVTVSVGELGTLISLGDDVSVFLTGIFDELIADYLTFV